MVQYSTVRYSTVLQRCRLAATKNQNKCTSVHILYSPCLALLIGIETCLFLLLFIFFKYFPWNICISGHPDTKWPCLSPKLNDLKKHEFFAKSLQGYSSHHQPAAVSIPLIPKNKKNDACNRLSELAKKNLDFVCIDSCFNHHKWFIIYFFTGQTWWFSVPVT